MQTQNNTPTHDVTVSASWMADHLEVAHVSAEGRDFFVRHFGAGCLSVTIREDGAQEFFAAIAAHGLTIKAGMPGG